MQEFFKIIERDEFQHATAEHSARFTEAAVRRDPPGHRGTFDRSRSVVNVEKLTVALTNPNDDQFVVGSSPVMRQLFDTIRRYARSEAPVLIVGETGTGKELVANAIHQKSRRANGPFKAVNCAAIPSTLIASELFGYEKGAFTGAIGRKVGIIEAAKGGTLFLDEIGHLPIELQGYMLRFLQENTIQRVGGVNPIPVDVRVIAASNVNFEKMILDGLFRADLFYRINVLAIHPPSLRERPEDIELLARFFLGRFAAEAGRSVSGFTPGAVVRLRNHRWPGNVRELMACIQRAVLLSDSELIDINDLDLADHSETLKPEVTPLSSNQNSKVQIQRMVLIDAIKQCDGNLTQTAVMLGITRVWVYRLVRKFGLLKEVEVARRQREEQIRTKGGVTSLV